MINLYHYDKLQTSLLTPLIQKHHINPQRISFESLSFGKSAASKSSSQSSAATSQGQNQLQRLKPWSCFFRWFLYHFRSNPFISLHMKMSYFQKKNWEEITKTPNRQQTTNTQVSPFPLAGSRAACQRLFFIPWQDCQRTTFQVVPLLYSLNSQWLHMEVDDSHQGRSIESANEPIQSRWLSSAPVATWIHVVAVWRYHWSYSKDPGVAGAMLAVLGPDSARSSA